MLLGCVGSAVVVAVGVGLRPAAPTDPRLHAAGVRASSLLPYLTVVPQRVPRDDYRRTAFGQAWSDEASVADGGNGCDTRNDILARDLVDRTVGPVSSCPHAVTAGEFRSPYTGEFIVFRRGRGGPGRAGGAVQIDHIVPLAYAWDMGAWAWSPTTRLQLANDPANLVAVDGASNQDKSDKAPGVWMPPEAGFHCQYAIQFVTVSSTYRLAVDSESRAALSEALRRC